MKIKTKLRLNIWISLLITVLITISLFWSFLEIYRTIQNENLVAEMQKTAFERTALRDDYLLNREARASIQWQVKSEDLRKIMETAYEKFSSTEDKLLLQEAQKNFDATFTIFSEIIEKDKRRASHASSKTFSDEAEMRQIGQVFLKAYALMDIINSLNESTMREKTKAQNRGLLLIIILFVGGGIAIIVNSISLNRTVAKRLTALNQGIEIIGNGNLDYKITLKGHDELTDLAGGVNEMVAKLNQSYTSIKNLQTEISEREKAEGFLRENERFITTVMDHLPLGVAVNSVDPAVSFVYMNDNFFKIYRTSREALTDPDTFWEVVYHDPVFREKIRKRVLDDCASGDPERMNWEDIPITRGGEETTYISARNIPIPDKPLMISTVIDVTERKLSKSQIEAMLEEIKKLNEELEKRVAERTAELTAKTSELERINRVFVDRELRMRDLKAKIAELEKKENVQGE